MRIIASAHTALCIIAITLITVLVGCTSGGQSFEKNGFCNQKYSPLTLEADANYDKTTLKPGEPFLPSTEAQEYAYAGMDFFYFDKANNIKLHLQEVVQDGVANQPSESKLSINCAGGKGIGFGMEPATYTLTFVSDLKTSTDGILLIKTRTVYFDLRPRETGMAWLIKSVTAEDESFKVGAPQDFFADFQEAAQYFLKPKALPQEYFLLSHLKNAIRDQKSGRDGELIVRTRVHMKVTKN